MNEKVFPLTKERTIELIKQFPTPFHIYDEGKIRANCRRLREAFAWAPGFREHFAVKALPNPRIVQLLHEEGAGTDCSSIAELLISEAAGVTGEEIMLTSNDTPFDEFQKSIELGAVINLDDITHLDYMAKHAGLPEVLSFRYNPGDTIEGNDIIGKPVEAKYGLTHAQMLEGYARAREMGVRRFGLHTMVISAELRTEAFLLTARIMFELAVELKEKLGIHVEFVNLGGGFGIPYRPEEDPVDFAAVGAGIERLYHEIMRPAELGDVAIRTESGRAVTGDAGWLVSTVLHKKNTYKKYVGLDSCMANLMRPALYGAYHHITVLGKEHAPADHVYDVTGSLCENNDKFAVDRALPQIDIGDIVVIHDTGAHGSAMGFNYNGKLHCAELLLHEDGTVELIRRAQTLDDYFATLHYEGSLMKSTNAIK
ncbi:putative diaminopimelate decarboxylase [Selenomonas sp. oral taxon 137 str. F0430]|uniref:diaminopimelate decarboxylase family protein n=1 Tax=Selenomonas sp. oral taxon 137 TaxID=712531 RepID=UPI0001EB3195|nr:diaminopimelate decarboxylase [Selenomonas sp. oral taxon 137]EFR39877.1 putative diaminopimelate decarboxylase [Selenomonas sp. oral taxon 137 str. F0430]